VTDALGNVTSYSYDANANPLTTIDARGYVTTTTYDVMGRLTQQTDAPCRSPPSTLSGCFPLLAAEFLAWYSGQSAQAHLLPRL
jgi:YD repeat-containing protein